MFHIIFSLFFFHILTKMFIITLVFCASANFAMMVHQIGFMYS